MSFAPSPAAPKTEPGPPSQLRHWPIQLHLINPRAPHYRGSNLLLAADCVPFTLADFHHRYLSGKTLAIACPKLDSNQDAYVEKLAALMESSLIESITVMIMQVPCCSGLLRLAQAAAAQSRRPVPIECIVISLQGEVLERMQASPGGSP